MVIPYENASIDSFAKTLQDIMDGSTNETHKYYRLSHKTTYKRIYYYDKKNIYKVNEPPKNTLATGEEGSVPSVSG